MQTDKTDPSELIGPGEAADLLHVTTRTLLRMAERGQVRSIILPSRHRRYIRADIESMRTSIPSRMADRDARTEERAA